MVEWLGWYRGVARGESSALANWINWEISVTAPRTRILNPFRAFRAVSWRRKVTWINLTSTQCNYLSIPICLVHTSNPHDCACCIMSVCLALKLFFFYSGYCIVNVCLSICTCIVYILYVCILPLWTHQLKLTRNCCFDVYTCVYIYTHTDTIRYIYSIIYMVNEHGLWTKCGYTWWYFDGLMFQSLRIWPPRNTLSEFPQVAGAKVVARLEWLELKLRKQSGTKT